MILILKGVVVAREYGKANGLKEIGMTKAQLMEGYQCTLVAPKSLIPVAFFRKSANLYAFSPDLSRYIGKTYWGDDMYVDGEECTRQHMQPGLVNYRDRGKGLGTAMYLGGCLSLPYNTCTYSIEGDRSAFAEGAWESLNYHDLSTKEMSVINHYFEDQIDADMYIPSSTAAEIADDILRGMDVYGATVDDYSVGGYFDMTVEATSETEVDNLKEETILEESSLVLHDVHNRDFTPIPPDGLAVIDWKYTPYSLFQDILEQQYEMLIEGPKEEYAQMVAEQLRKRKKRMLAEYALTTFNESTGRKPKLRGPAIQVRNNSSKVRKEFQKLGKVWMGEYTKGNWP